MNNPARTQLENLMAHVEEMWAHLGTLFDDLKAGNGWTHQHGAEWTFADVPYHLAYCNRDIVASGLQYGAKFPEAEQELLASPEAIGAWNARKFAERPAGQTAAQSVAQWRDSCAQIRQLTAEMDDADLDSPFWMPLMAGWTTARAGLDFCRAHDWSEFTQLRIHMGREQSVPSAGVTRNYLRGAMGFFPLFLNPEEAAGQQFTAVMAFTDPGVGAFTIQVADGAATIQEGHAPQADLVMTQSATTFEKTLRRILDPAEAIQSGQLQVSDFEQLATFGRLFPMP